MIVEASVLLMVLLLLWLLLKVAFVAVEGAVVLGEDMSVDVGITFMVVEASVSVDGSVVVVVVVVEGAFVAVEGAASYLVSI